MAKKWIYLVHPYTTNGIPPVVNMERCKRLAIKLAKSNPDIFVFSPLHAMSFMDTPYDDNLALEYCGEALRSRKFQEIWLSPGWKESDGCKWEKGIAEEVGMKVVDLEPKIRDGVISIVYRS